jgi:hypothetical protein
MRTSCEQSGEAAFESARHRILTFAQRPPERALGFTGGNLISVDESEFKGRRLTANGFTDRITKASVRY